MLYNYPFNRITRFQIEGNGIDPQNQPYAVEYIDATDLVIWSRFDLMAKWVYIDAREKGIDTQWALSLYWDNINAFSCGSFIEPGSDDKNSFCKYIESFDRIIDSIKNSGFNEEISMIPVDKYGEILDGSHRVAAAAYYGKRVSVVKLLDKKALSEFDYKYFRKYLMSDINLGYMAMQYAHIKENCYMACIWPSADRDYISTALKMLNEIGPIVFEQDVYLTYQGMRLFMIQIYKHQAWTGCIEDDYDGVNYKVDPCYNSKYPIKTVLVESSCFDDVLRIKEKIRNLFGISNHSIHISDNKDETDDMVELLYNPNTVNFMNYARPFKYKHVVRGVERFKNVIAKNGLNKNRFIIDSSAVLEVCGLRLANDIDYLSDYIYDTDYASTLKTVNSQAEVENHESELVYHSVGIKDMLYNPTNYFYFFGMKYLALSCLIEMKSSRNEKKDIIDVNQCKRFIRNFKRTPKEYRYDTVDRINEYQKKCGHYGEEALTYNEYVKRLIVDRVFFWRKG